MMMSKHADVFSNSVMTIKSKMSMMSMKKRAVPPSTTAPTNEPTEPYVDPLIGMEPTLSYIMDQVNPVRLGMFGPEIFNFLNDTLPLEQVVVPVAITLFNAIDNVENSLVLEGTIEEDFAQYQGRNMKILVISTYGKIVGGAAPIPEFSILVPDVKTISWWPWLTV